MDQRETFSNADQLFSIVSTIYQQKQRGAFLIDAGGITRVEGEITAVEKNADINKSVIRIDKSGIILFEQIIGVNGVFRSDYTEC